MATNANAPVIPVVLQRDDPTQPWGFRIQGGADYRLHLAVKKVTPNTPAHNHLQAGDVILGIEGKDCTRMTHQQSHDMIASCPHTLNLMIKKGQYQVIKPTQKPIKYTQTGNTNLTILPVQNAYKRF